MIVTLSQRSAGPEKLGAGSNKVGANFLSRMRKHRMRPNRRSNQKNLLHPVQYWTNRFWFGVINHHASNPAGALAAMSGDWNVARIFSPTASALRNVQA